MKIRSNIISLISPIINRYYRHKCYSALPGSKDWLIGAEIKYGGHQTNVARNKVSPNDSRTSEQLNRGGMVGGDRMLHHGYAAKYSEFLLPFIKKDQTVTLVEIGILKGTGLAIWCDLFKKGRILGLDIDLGHISGNMNNLKSFGAFRTIEPELYEFDQFEDNVEYLGSILKNDKVDICIDDGCHSSESILSTMKSVLPHLADEFVYFIEDNRNVHESISSLCPDFTVVHAGELTIVSPS